MQHSFHIPDFNTRNMTALNMLKLLVKTVITQMLLFQDDRERYVIIFIYLEENTKCAKYR